VSTDRHRHSLIARRAAWRRNVRRRRRPRRRRLRRRPSAGRRRRSPAPLHSLRPPRMSMTASNGPADVEQRTAQRDRLRHAGTGRRQGRRRDREFELHGILRRQARAMKLGDGSDPALTAGKSNRRRTRVPGISPTPSACLRCKRANAPGYVADRLGQLALVQVAALQTKPPRMQPSSLSVFATRSVRLPE
jgi:hypothetical protein